MSVSELRASGDAQWIVHLSKRNCILKKKAIVEKWTV